MEILGIDIGGSGVKGAPVDIENGKLLAERHRIKTPKPATPQAIAGVVAKIARHFAWTGPIGCALPARVKHGVALTAANIDKGWIGTNAARLIDEATGCPTFVLNDADAAGVAEMAFGAGRGRHDYVLVLTVGTGIGSALFIHQTLVPNTELGHLELDGHDAESRASDAARKREDLSWHAWARRFQRYLSHVEFLLAPDLIIIGGGVSRPKKWAKFGDRLQTQAELMPALLQNEAGIIGAAYSARVLLEPEVTR
ncbi:MAG: polyphosphate glucokinase [Rhodothermaceae bacterium]|nr:MAG: ROK family protein [Bacteroidota bacterium]GIV61194.1 MAG: polyphosphate glucokinase [Rhodothermaceae bacterium]